jgi:glycosyltransferase involved in cell wall biosynthesis
MLVNVLNKSNPLITVVTSTYNAENHFENLAVSIANQKYKNIEWIVIDGASTDGTLNLVEKYKRYIAHIVSEPDHGIYDAWNKALNKITGDWVIFLGADDCFASPFVLHLLIEKLNVNNLQTKLIYGKVLQYSTSSHRSQVLGGEWSFAKKNFNAVMTIPHPGVFYHSSLFLEHGGFNPKFKIAGDYEYLLRIINAGVKPIFYNYLLVHMGGGGISSQPQHAVLSLKEALLARISLGIKPRYPIVWCVTYFFAYMKLFFYKVFGLKLLMFFINIFRFLNGRPIR